MSTPAPPWRQQPAINGSNGPAFTTVAARRTLGGPFQQTTTPPQLHEPQSLPSQRREWPQSVREYVQRAFAPENEIAGIGQEELRETLRNIITEQTEGGNLLNVNWQTMILPQQVIQMRRAAAPARQPWEMQLDGTDNNNMLSNDSPRKRKSPDSEPDDASLPPWRRRSGKTALEDRITRVDKDQPDKVDKHAKRLQKKKEQLGLGTSKFEADREKRSQRFGYEKASKVSPWARDNSTEPDADTGPIIGTCQDLEKRYFRLTAPPKPSTVRPLPVLQKTLELLKKKWRKEGNYNYICDQFKSLRQDLTVQHIKNEFTVHAYEIHARIALEQGDLSEYNQCQTQLRALYKQGLKGHPAEFLAYRILYFLYTSNTTGMNDVLADLTPTDKEAPVVKHALEVRSALALGNYHKFFRLYLATPNMGAYLLDKFVVRERLAALANICKVYKPSVKIRFLTEELGFEGDQECVQFLLDRGAQDLLEQKDEDIVFASGKAGLLFESAKTAAFPKKGGIS